MRAHQHLPWSMPALVAALLLGCQSPDRKPYSYYDERIAPMIDIGCQRQTTGCHVDDGRGFALGNLDCRRTTRLHIAAMRSRPTGRTRYRCCCSKPAVRFRSQVKTVDAPDPTQAGSALRHGHDRHPPRRRRGRDRAGLRRLRDAQAMDRRRLHTHRRAAAPICAKSIGSCVESAPGVDLTQRPIRRPALARSLRQQRAAGAGRALRGLELPRLADGRPVPDLRQGRRQQRWNYGIATALPQRAGDDQRADTASARAERGGGVYHEGGDIFADTSDREYKSSCTGRKDRRQAQAGAAALAARSRRRGPALLRQPRAAAVRAQGLHVPGAATRRRCSTTCGCAAARAAISPRSRRATTTRCRA